jgi:UDPglucose 6-dehydrogenase
MQIGIAGYGTVGQALTRFFGSSGGHRVAVYDKYVAEYRSGAQLAALDRCDVVFVAVPTPYDEASRGCDVSNVLDIAGRVNAPLCIKSTVPPGTIDHLSALTRKRIAYSPEYLGESPSHPWGEPDACGFVVLAGDASACELVQSAYESSSQRPLRYVRTDARTAELAKYMENCFLATKVAFANQPRAGGGGRGRLRRAA